MQLPEESNNRRTFGHLVEPRLKRARKLEKTKLIFPRVATYNKEIPSEQQDPVDCGAQFH